MSRELQKFCRSQFEDFEAELTSWWGIPSNVIQTLGSPLRGLHRRYLGVANLTTILGTAAKRSDHINAVPEVSYLSLVLILKGLENPSFVLMRQSIELVFKHIYFSTHPVEHSWVKSRVAFREITFQYLLEYLRKTVELQALSEGAELLKEIESEFHILSRYVHVHSNSFIRFSRYSGHRKAHVNSLHSFEERSRELWPRLCVLMVVFFPSRFLKASALEQRLVRASLSSDLAKRINLFLKNLALQ